MFFTEPPTPHREAFRIDNPPWYDYGATAMLDDRLYMRQTEYRPYRSAVITLIILNAVLFVLQSILEFYKLFPVRRFFYLSQEGLQAGFFWQLITFQFLHGGLLHLLFNLFALYMFGRPVEDTLGRAGFLKLYLLSGILGGMVQILMGALLPRFFGGAVVGASAGVFGLVAAFATLYPEQPLTMLLAFIIPVQMRAKFLLLIEALITVFGILVPNDGIAHGAHLGGMLMGIAYIRWGMNFEHLIFRWRRKPRIHPKPPLIKVAKASSGYWKQPPKEVAEELSPEEFISKEVDPILDKINAHGFQSLTEREKRILDAAKSRINRR